MYEFVFKELGLRLPFSPLATEIFKYLKLAPSQLHPNAMAFVLAFEHLCEYTGVVPTRALFFRVFQLQRMTKEFGRKSWVSFKNRVSLFDMYAESLRGFKSRFYMVRAETQTGRNSLYDYVIDRNEDGSVRKNEDGTDKLKKVEKFPLTWTSEHFDQGTGSYLTADGSLSAEERRGLKALQTYVAGLQPARLVTRAGEPVLDEEGNEQFSPRLINTKRLLECRTRVEVHEVLDTMADFAADLSKIVSEKKLTGGAGKIPKKRKLANRGSAVFTSGSSSPGGCSSSLGTKVTSPTVLPKSNLVKGEVPFIDVDAEMGRPFLLPRVMTDKEFLGKNSLQVVAVEKAAILKMDGEVAHDQIIDDSAALLRMLERVLVLQEDKNDHQEDLEKMKGAYTKLEAENMKLENEVVDLRGKKENFVAAAKENRELKDEVAKFEEERKKYEEEIKALKSALAPAEDETENTRELSTRADFVARIRKLGDSVLAGMKHSWQNALAQVKVANPGVELTFDGMGVFREVVNGQIILPEKYREAEAAELEGDDEMDDDVDEEEDDGSSKKDLTPEEEV
ncbi:hypothetical protein P8452_21344 [Trifolium repens]|nr:hypothetical protein P8452_21344 [Trifolium repens]